MSPVVKKIISYGWKNYVFYGTLLGGLIYTPCICINSVVIFLSGLCFCTGPCLCVYIYATLLIYLKDHVEVLITQHPGITVAMLTNLFHKRTHGSNILLAKLNIVTSDIDSLFFSQFPTKMMEVSVHWWQSKSPLLYIYPPMMDGTVLFYSVVVMVRVFFLLPLSRTDFLLSLSPQYAAINLQAGKLSSWLWCFSGGEGLFVS